MYQVAFAIVAAEENYKQGKKIKRQAEIICNAIIIAVMSDKKYVVSMAKLHNVLQSNYKDYKKQFTEQHNETMSEWRITVNELLLRGNNI